MAKANVFAKVVKRPSGKRKNLKLKVPCIAMPIEARQDASLNCCVYFP